MIAIVENSPGLAGYFERVLERQGVPFRTHAVHRGEPFPEMPFDACILTGDYSNISDGLLPYHEQEMAFIRGIPRSRRVFGSCFAHQLMAHLHGGRVRRRDSRFFGWKEITMRSAHPVFAGIEAPRFVCLNGDEVGEPAPGSVVIGEAEDCAVQVVTYEEHILTLQSHPEILVDDVREILAAHGPALRERCPRLEEMHRQTLPLADDAASLRFLDNLVAWLQG